MTYVLGQALNYPGVAPWDGTGVDLPVDENGWPVVPGGGGEPRPSLAWLYAQQTLIHEGTALEVRVDVFQFAADGVTPEPSPATGTATVHEASGLLADFDVTVAAAYVPYPGSEGLTAGTVLSLTATYHGDPDFAPSTSTPPLTVTYQAPAEDAGFDPAEHTVAEVQAYLADNPDQTDIVLDRERAGKARTSLIGD
jgi:hypothetical protein